MAKRLKKNKLVPYATRVSRKMQKMGILKRKPSDLSISNVQIGESRPPTEIGNLHCLHLVESMQLFRKSNPGKKMQNTVAPASVQITEPFQVPELQNALEILDSQILPKLVDSEIQVYRF